MIQRHSSPLTWRLTLAADRVCDSADFVAELPQTCGTPPVARTIRHAGYALSRKHCNKIEEPSGWGKTIAGMAQTVLRGIERNRARFTLTMAACNLARRPRLLADGRGGGPSRKHPSVDQTRPRPERKQNCPRERWSSAAR
jgi:hypothetical protein